MLHRDQSRKSSLIVSPLSRRRLLHGIAGMGAGYRLASPPGGRAQPAPPVPVTTHPRLFVTAEDLPRLRSWATDDNPFWREGLQIRAESALADMDAGRVPGDDSGTNSWDQYPTEMYASFFAFLSLIHPDAERREDFANRARSLLMYVISEAGKGAADDRPFRDPYFALGDRSRWWGEGFALTVDWIYPYLATEEKSAIRSVFLRWANENLHAGTTDHNHPEPIGVANDPVLLADPIKVRWSGNNYFTAHMRNLGLMALAFDPEDDPGGELTGHLESATGAWLYMVDHLLRTDARGGLATEGFEYAPQALAYIVQFQLALLTAGQDDPARWGEQVVLRDNPFWEELIPALLHSLSPGPALLPDYEWLGPVYQPAWYGDGQKYWCPDTIAMLGALGRYDELTGDSARLDQIRWMQTHLPPGGADVLLDERVARVEEFLNAILYFLLFDPAAPEPVDPRPALPLHYFAAGTNRLLVRTGWDEFATWFTYGLSWNSVDHQHADGNQFEFYRNAEWLTKERTGYGNNIGASDYHNTLTLENDPPDHNDPDDYRSILWQRGSQWFLNPSGDPELVALSVEDDYVYALGDTTNLYNSTYELATDIVHASRSILWLRPDHIVILDRAESKTDGRFKRFWLNLPFDAAIDGNRTLMTTANGQQLAVTTLLPENASISVDPAEPLEEESEPAAGDPMQFRLRVEAPGGPRKTSFFHVLQGLDRGQSPDEIGYVRSVGGADFAGVSIGGIGLLFPVEIGIPVDELVYVMPAAIERHLVTGLAPLGAYLVETSVADGERRVSIRVGGDVGASDAGVLDLVFSG